MRRKVVGTGYMDDGAQLYRRGWQWLPLKNTVHMFGRKYMGCNLENVQNGQNLFFTPASH